LTLSTVLETTAAEVSGGYRNMAVPRRGGRQSSAAVKMKREAAATGLSDSQMQGGATVLGYAMRTLIFVLLVGLLPGLSVSWAEEKIAKRHQTTLGLYCHPAQAAKMLKEGKGKVYLLDVRTPGEYVFLGHPAEARNIPYSFLVEEWSAALKKPDMQLNAKFVEEVKAHYKPDDTIILMCRSGDRSARGVDLLAKAGFTKAYTMLEGFQGDMIDGRRSKFGWANRGLPWTYELNPDLVYQGKNK